ncbi:MAG: bifunctional sugar-1-phosphate nucleotidylyltransferase/acetyltransferase [Halodesulfurarchaeum sp.]
MQTVLLAAGEGTRMRPLTSAVPKPMLPVAGSPLLEHTIEAAIDAGASRIVLVIGYEGDTIVEHFGDRYRSTQIEYARQTEQRGTAHAVESAIESLEEGPFAVLNGDALYDPGSLSRLFEAGPAIGSFRVDNPGDYGVLELDDDVLHDVREKPQDPSSDLINAGAYVFPEAARSWLDVETSSRGERELTDVLERAIERTTIRAVQFDRWLDVGRPFELLEANEWKLGELDRRIDGDVHESAEIRGDVVIEPGAEVRSGVVISGPVRVKSGASVGPNAYVRGATLLESDVHVGHAVEIKNSVLMSGTNVGHLSYVGDSVIGQESNFGAGTTVANLRHDGDDVTMTSKGDRVSTGRRKFGVVCGPGVKTGINTSLNAGVTLPEGGTTAPGETVLTDPD